MRWKVFVLIIIFFLIVGAAVLTVGKEMSMIIGIIVLIAVAFVGTAYMMRSGEEREPETKNGKDGYEHHPDVRGTSLGCYGAEAEEEKFAYEETPPPESQQKR